MALSGLSLYLKAPQLAASLGLLESDGQGRQPKQIHTLRRPVVFLEQDPGGIGKVQAGDCINASECVSAFLPAREP